MTNTTNNPVSDKIFVRTKNIIFLHWFNAVCWFLLTPSGLGIIRGESIRIIPAAWSEFMQNMVGGNANLVFMHSSLGIIWSAGILLFTVRNWKQIVVPFLKKIITITPKSIMDDIWFTAVVMTRLIVPSKVEGELPPSGRYNGAQRLLSTMIIICSITIAVTGLGMFFGPGMAISSEIFRWSLVLHASCVGMVWIGLLAHIYFGMIEEPKSLEGMKSGYLEVEFIKHHNPMWYEDLKQHGEIKR